jgi:hypothetical protein
MDGINPEVIGVSFIKYGVSERNLRVMFSAYVGSVFTFDSKNMLVVLSTLFPSIGGSLLMVLG